MVYKSEDERRDERRDEKDKGRYIGESGNLLSCTPGPAKRCQPPPPLVTSNTYISRPFPSVSFPIVTPQLHTIQDLPNKQIKVQTLFGVVGIIFFFVLLRCGKPF